ncbi:LysR family transcriptional regulator [Nitrincola alkalisediminis]|uniref:LysR family transcriptional regulator n=1 Tax=Nitrincola alkalisediminis TaxID=1366656 RepID=UPI0018757377|nr:LysR family transcriptional regulator [Nitrincola alkalisediminis]
MNLRHLTFRLLEVYVAVVRAGNISEAARRLHLTQPTVSLQLKRLNETVGEPLLVSHKGQLQMTDAGLALYNACQELLGRFQELNDTLSELQLGHQGRLSIAMVNTAQYVLPKLLGPFSQSFPDVDITLEIGNRAQMLTRFNQQLDDIYIFSHPPSLEHAAAARFLRNPLVLIAPTHHPFHKRSQVSLKELTQERFLLREPGSATRMLFDSWLRTQGIQLTKSMQIASNDAIRVAVEASMGVAVISQHVIPEGQKGIAILPVESLPIESHWHFIVRRDRRISKTAKLFLTFVDAHLERYLEPDFACHEISALLDEVIGF